MRVNKSLRYYFFLGILSELLLIYCLIFKHNSVYTIKPNVFIFFLGMYWIVPALVVKKNISLKAEGMYMVSLLIILYIYGHYVSFKSLM